MILKQYQYLYYLAKTHLVNVSSSLLCGTTNKDSLMAKMIICIDSDRSHYTIRNGYKLCWLHSLHHASCVHDFIFDPGWVVHINRVENEYFGILNEIRCSMALATIGLEVRVELTEIRFIFSNVCCSYGLASSHSKYPSKHGSLSTFNVVVFQVFYII